MTTRRDFIKSAAIVGAVASVPTAIAISPAMQAFQKLKEAERTFDFSADAEGFWKDSDMRAFHNMLDDLAHQRATDFQDVAAKVLMGTTEGAGCYHENLLASAWADANRLLKPLLI